jgi:hypothetical protein
VPPDAIGIFCEKSADLDAAAARFGPAARYNIMLRTVKAFNFGPHKSVGPSIFQKGFLVAIIKTCPTET